MTTKMAATIMNVSERSIYMARKVMQLAPHFEGEIMSGKLSLNEAYRLVTNKPKPIDRLLRAWNAASNEDRLKLIRAAGITAADRVGPG
jgi:hypothetical protein